MWIALWARDDRFRDRRALHVIAVVLWIGGAGMVTTILLPAIRRAHARPDRFAAFHAIEARFRHPVPLPPRSRA